MDTAADLSGSHEYTDCVFYGNNNYLGESSGYVSSYTVSGISQPTVAQILTDPSTNTTYAAFKWTQTNVPELANRFAQYLGGELCCMETPEEQAFLQTNLKSSTGSTDYNGKTVYYDDYRYRCGLRADENGTLRWLNGDAAAVEVFTDIPKCENYNYDGGD